MTKNFHVNQGDVTDIQQDKVGRILHLEKIVDDEFVPRGVNPEVYKVRKYEEDRKKVMAALDAKRVS